ncbi:hypothetical protein V12B01_07905 [Vibrio splendidus 12B01]|nr:hypothetical protein V12B01_07905 [Vibrio splendidus 12B01]
MILWYFAHQSLLTSVDDLFDRVIVRKLQYNFSLNTFLV